MRTATLLQSNQKKTSRPNPDGLQSVKKDLQGLGAWASFSVLNPHTSRTIYIYRFGGTRYGGTTTIYRFYMVLEPHTYIHYVTSMVELVTRLGFLRSLRSLRVS